jgi:hypothetical protein
MSNDRPVVRVDPAVTVRASFPRGDEEMMCEFVFNAEAVRKIGFSPTACAGGIEVPIEDLDRILECLEVEPSPFISKRCGPRGEDEAECGDDLCFELPNGLIICPR